MSKQNRVAAIFVAIGFALGAVIGGGATAAYAATAYGGWSTWTVNGISYTTRTYVTDAAGGVGGVQVKRSSGTTSPAGYLGGQVNLYRSTTLCRASTTQYNGSSIVQLVVQIGKQTCYSGNFRSTGIGYAYNSATGDYSGRIPPASPYLPLP